MPVRNLNAKAARLSYESLLGGGQKRRKKVPKPEPEYDDYDTYGESDYDEYDDSYEDYAPKPKRKSPPKKKKKKRRSASAESDGWFTNPLVWLGIPFGGNLLLLGLTALNLPPIVANLFVLGLVLLCVVLAIVGIFRCLFSHKKLDAFLMLISAGLIWLGLSASLWIARAVF